MGAKNHEVYYKIPFGLGGPFLSFTFAQVWIDITKDESCIEDFMLS